MPSVNMKPRLKVLSDEKRLSHSLTLSHRGFPLATNDRNMAFSAGESAKGCFCFVPSSSCDWPRTAARCQGFGTRRIDISDDTHKGRRYHCCGLSWWSDVSEYRRFLCPESHAMPQWDIWDYRRSNHRVLRPVSRLSNSLDATSPTLFGLGAAADMAIADDQGYRAVFPRIVPGARSSGTGPSSE